jgi:hypothetical protein
MPIDLNTAQAQKVAALASELGGQISLHQVTGGADVYVGPVGSDHRFLVAATGEAREVEQPPPAAGSS